MQPSCSAPKAIRILCGCAAALLLHACNGGADTHRNDENPAPDTQAPGAPSELAAQAASSSSVDLTWKAATDNVGVVAYRVYRSGAASFVASVTSTTYADAGLAANTEYTYSVRAVDAAGNESPASNTANATTLAATAIAGLDRRPSNVTCVAWARSTAQDSISLTRFTSLTFDSPVAMLQAPQDDRHWYIVQQGGIVQRFDATAPTSATQFVDLTSRVRSGGEMGLLGMAFHPAFPTDNRVFLSYTTGTPLVSRISAFRSTDNGATLDPSTETVLLTVNQPEENHNGGNIAFGKDGFLYIGFGDGGGGGDAHGNPGNGQRLTTLLGKMLRIDVNGASPYAIPAGNPFVNNALCPAAGRSSSECPEIFAWGFRNPWRWSFDRSTGALWVADVGQGNWEEVDQVTLGGNYGWRCREGAHDYNSSGTTGCTGSFVEPLAEYGHDVGVSITGGYVYRGTQNTALQGKFLFGDFGSGRIWAWIAEDAKAPRQPTLLLQSGLGISAFGQGNNGELYVVDYSGTLQHIDFQRGAATGAVPATLSATGCVDPTDPRKPAAGLIPYTVNASFWSDGADKQRWLAIPDNTKIDVQQSGDWSFPNGAVLMKSFTVADRLVETRLLLHHPDGSWGGVTYEWNAAQTDATLLSGGAMRDLGSGQQWLFPSESQCLECHTSAAGFTLGLRSDQLNRDLTYPQTQRTANQLDTLTAIAMLNPGLDSRSQPKLTDPQDTSATVESRARAYLDANCSQCHQPNGPTPSTMDLRANTALAAMNACNALPQAGDAGLGAEARLINPGNAARSVITERMKHRDALAMPPLGSLRVDDDGVALIAEWIDGLAGC